GSVGEWYGLHSCLERSRPSAEAAEQRVVANRATGSRRFGRRLGGANSVAVFPGPGCRSAGSYPPSRRRLGGIRFHPGSAAWTSTLISGYRASGFSEGMEAIHHSRRGEQRDRRLAGELALQKAGGIPSAASI